MRDDWYGHRDFFTGIEVGDKDEWLDWDHALADALQTIEDYTDEYGLLAWELADEAVEVDAVKRIHKFRQALEQRTSGSKTKPYKPTPGEYFVPRVSSRRKDPEGNEVIQSYTEWVEKESSEEA